MNFAELKSKTSRNRLCGVEYVIDTYLDGNGFRVLYRTEPDGSFLISEKPKKIIGSLLTVEQFSMPVQHMEKEWGLELYDQIGDYRSYTLIDPHKSWQKGLDLP